MLPIDAMPIPRSIAPWRVAAVIGMSACASGSGVPIGTIAEIAASTAPLPDPRVGLAPGLFEAEEAIWNLNLLSTTPPPSDFVGSPNSDLAFKDNYAVQGSYGGFLVWDISDPRAPTLVTSYSCSTQQGDVSVYGDLLFVSSEGLGGRLDCSSQGVEDRVSPDRLRGIRIFDISDIGNPRYIHDVQTCRGSHTHTVLEDPRDDQSIYIYVSGLAPVRPSAELSGCSGAPLEQDPNSTLFRIEVIRVPLAEPEEATVVSSPRILAGLVAPPAHGLAPDELAAVEEARAAGQFILDPPDNTISDTYPSIVSDTWARDRLDSIVEARGGSGEPSAADSSALRTLIRQMAERVVPARPPTQCHDITVYPAIGLAGAACAGYGMLIDISDPLDPRRVGLVSDENFSYWHSATFNNDGTKILFMDEWGGGQQPKCRRTDPSEWGADAIFTIESREMRFHSYYKMIAPQTGSENCVAHNGSLIPIPGRDVMVQSWLQGGISVFDWTDPTNPVEIAFHDRGPVSSEGQLTFGGSWSAYWYNGIIVSSEITRGIDIFELTASRLLTQNELDAANTVRLAYLNAQDQPRFVWPTSFALARAYVDQLERSSGLPPGRLETVRRQLTSAESDSREGRLRSLTALASRLASEAAASRDATKVQLLAMTVLDLAGM